MTFALSSQIELNLRRRRKQKNNKKIRSSYWCSYIVNSLNKCNALQLYSIFVVDVLLVAIQHLLSHYKHIYIMCQHTCVLFFVCVFGLARSVHFTLVLLYLYILIFILLHTYYVSLLLLLSYTRSMNGSLFLSLFLFPDHQHCRCRCGGHTPTTKKVQCKQNTHACRM